MTLSQLVCGAPGGAHSRLGNALDHLRDTLDRLLSECPTPIGLAAGPHPLYSPFLARSILEVACTAMIARLDPFRILTLAELQSHSSYTPGKKVTAALQWQGDVLAESKEQLWTQDRKVEHMPRALLGEYQDAVFWQPAFEYFLDVVATRGSTSARVAALQGFQINEFLPRIRAAAVRTYSAASKGIHHEFVLPLSSYYDPATLRSLLDDSIHIAADLGVVTNCCEHIAFRLEPVEAISLYEAIQ